MTIFVCHPHLQKLEEYRCSVIEGKNKTQKSKVEQSANECFETNVLKLDKNAPVIQGYSSLTAIYTKFD